ncbi:CvpA family protein [bacterium]
MPYSDVLALILLLVFAGIGYYLGAVRAVFSLLSLFIGSYIAGMFYTYASQFLPQNNWTLLFTFAILFFTASSIILLIGKLLSKFIKQIFLKTADRIAGMMVMTFLGFVLIGFLYNITNDFSPNNIKKFKINQSKIIGFVINVDNYVYKVLPSSLGKKLNKIAPKKIEKAIEVK